MTRKRKKKPRVHPRCSDLQLEQRIDQLLRIVLDGAVDHDIREYVREMTSSTKPEDTAVWGNQPLTYSQIRRYMVQVIAKRNEIANLYQPHQEALAENIAIRRSLFAKALQQGDTRTALACINSEADFRGINPTQQKLDALQAMIEALEERLKHAGQSNREAEETDPGSPGNRDAPEPQPPVPPLPE